MKRLGKVLLLSGSLAFLAALTLPAINNNFGEFATGFDVRGYKCAVGVFLMPLARPLASPLWILLAAGNLWVVAAPCLLLAGRGSPTLFSGARWVMLLASLGCCLLTLLRKELGLTAIHLGYGFWAASHLLVCAGTWLTWPATATR